MGTVNSIRGKFLQLTIISILLCALLLGSVALASVSSMQTYTARELLSLTCRAEGAELEATLHSIRAAVDVFSDLADAQVSSLLQLRNDSFLDVFCEEVEYTMLELARETPGVCACYFRIAPEMTRLPTGFFYSVHAGSDEFVRETLTDLDQYAPADGDHVGWYYLPQRAGHAVWLEPYYNQNLGVYMISYVCPLYRDGVFWGVAGMDIDFDVITSAASSPMRPATPFWLQAAARAIITPSLPWVRTFSATAASCKPSSMPLRTSRIHTRQASFTITTAASGRR